MVEHIDIARMTAYRYKHSEKFPLNRPLFLAPLLLLACYCGLASANGQSSGAAPQPIDAVWLTSQACMGPASETMTRSPEAEKIKAEGAVELRRLGVRYQIPKLPKLEKFVLKLALDDKSRGLSDNYLLFSDSEINPPVGALVVTTLPPDTPSAKAVFDVVDSMQRDLAKSSYIHLERREIADLRMGQGIEYLAPDRVSSPCFPTSRFKFFRPNQGMRTVGISRFFVQGGQLVESSFIVDVPEAMTPDERNAFVRAEMDSYLSGLAFTQPSH